jgi:multiple sugar transport system permease protein
MTTRVARRSAAAAATLGLLLLTAAGVWWMVYYAKAGTATRTYRDGLAPLVGCLAATSERCAALRTGNELRAPWNFLDERRGWPEYVRHVAAPNGVVRYHPALFWLGALLLAAGIAVAVTRRDVGLRSLLDHDAFVAYLFIIPSLVGFFVFFIQPAFNALLIAFHDWNLLRAPRYVGIANFERLFADERFWRSLRITGAYVLYNIPLQTLLALGIAALLDRTSHWLTGVVRGLMVIPWLLPPVVVGLLWLWMLDPLLGIVNAFLGLFGIARQPFLGSPNQVIPTIAGINVWQYTGYTALLFFAGLKTIPRELYQAAAIDGANAFRQFWHVTLPLLRPVTVFVLVTSVIGSFQVFDTIAITTSGGPAGSSMVILMYIYDKIFNRAFDMGLAAAASVVLFSILVFVTIAQLRLSRSGESDLAEYG